MFVVLSPSVMVWFAAWQEMINTSWVCGWISFFPSNFMLFTQRVSMYFLCISKPPTDTNYRYEGALGGTSRSLLRIRIGSAHSILRYGPLISSWYPLRCKREATQDIGGKTWMEPWWITRIHTGPEGWQVGAHSMQTEESCIKVGFKGQWRDGWIARFAGEGLCLCCSLSPSLVWQIKAQ